MKIFLSALLTLIFSFYLNTQIAFASSSNDLQIDKDNENKIESLKNKNESSISKKDSGDIFGDEQTFPFVAGLGKNAAH